jgi:hypothetical protein
MQQRMIENLKVGPYAMRYSQFVPRLYNLCRSLGFERDRMLPSRAFCSDESQGYPVILIAQHFGTFPFDHGRVGGKVSVNRHGPYAAHGEDLVIIQASHVGYDADSGRFGVYRRARTESCGFGSNCGKLAAVLHWYHDEYQRARELIRFGKLDGEAVVYLDNQYLDDKRTEGLFPKLDQLVEEADDPVKALATSKAYLASQRLRDRLPADRWQDEPQALAAQLTADLFSFRKPLSQDPEEHDILEMELFPAMPALVTSVNPALDAARFVTQVEFDRCYRSILREPAYTGKNLMFISGVNIDVSPREGFPFPLIKFVPWAAYVSLRDGRKFLLEQAELNEQLRSQSPENPDRLLFDDSIRRMADAEEIRLGV